MNQCGLPFHSGQFIPLFACVPSFSKFRMCPRAHRSGPFCVHVCVSFTTGLTLPIKFSGPAVNFIGGVKAQLGCGFASFVRVCDAEAQRGDRGRQRTRCNRSSKYVTQISFFKVIYFIRHRLFLP